VPPRESAARGKVCEVAIATEVAAPVAVAQRRMPLGQVICGLAPRSRGSTSPSSWTYDLVVVVRYSVRRTPPTISVSSVLSERTTCADRPA
jgi:hypothetical protein